MADNAYETAVALETLQTLRWKKTPGKDEIKAELEMAGDSSLISQAIMYILMELTDGGRRAIAPGEQSSSRIEDNELTIAGKSIISHLVNQHGVQFSGSDDYRSTALGRH